MRKPKYLIRDVAITVAVALFMLTAAGANTVPKPPATTPAKPATIKMAKPITMPVMPAAERLNAIAPPEAPIVDTYPASLATAAQDSIIDRFGMSNRECVSYTAWKVQQAYGNMPDWTTYQPNPAPDASHWVERAQAAGIATGSQPRAHSVAVAMPGVSLGHGLMAAGSGHTMWVERINGDGTVRVSQYNADETGHFSVSDVPASGLIYIYFGG